MQLGGHVRGFSSDGPCARTSSTNKPSAAIGAGARTNAQRRPEDNASDLLIIGLTLELSLYVSPTWAFPPIVGAPVAQFGVSVRSQSDISLSPRSLMALMRYTYCLSGSTVSSV